MDGAQAIKADLIPGCAFRAVIPKQARLTIGAEYRNSGSITVENPKNLRTKNYIEQVYLGFSCYDSNADLVGSSPVRFDEHSGRWVKDTQNFIKQFSEPEWQQNYGRAIRFYELSNVSAKGFAYTQDDVIGDERYRTRQLRYCLIRPPNALCGQSEMGNLREIKKNPQADWTPYALKIVRSIEFFDGSTPVDITPLPALEEHTGFFGPGCHVKILVPSIGQFTFSRGEFTLRGEHRRGTGWGQIDLNDLLYPYSTRWSHRFDCNGSSDTRYNLARWVASSSTEHGITWYLTEEGRARLQEGTLQFYEFQTKDASGVAVTVDQTKGDIQDYNNRRRILYSCLVHLPVTVCGSSTMGYLHRIRQIPQADLTPYVLSILRSIEFLKDEPPPIAREMLEDK